MLSENFEINIIDQLFNIYSLKKKHIFERTTINFFYAYYIP